MTPNCLTAMSNTGPLNTVMSGFLVGAGVTKAAVSGCGGLQARLAFSEAAACWSHDDHGIARFHGRARASLQCLEGGAAANNIRAELARFAAVQPEGAHLPVSR